MERGHEESPPSVATLLNADALKCSIIHRRWARPLTLLNYLSGPCSTLAMIAWSWFTIMKEQMI